MMTIVDTEKKAEAVKICEKLYENGYVFKFKEDYKRKYIEDDTYPYLSVVPTNLCTHDELIKLFKEKGFDAWRYNRNPDITLEFHKEVPNLSLEDCFEI